MFEKQELNSTKPQLRAPVITSTHDLSAFLTIDEVGALLRKSRKAIYAMVERGQLPGVVRISRRLLIRKPALLDFLDHKTCTPSAKEI